MTDIKLIVKIDADVYTRLFDNGIQDNEIATDDICEMARALRLGKPYEERKTGKWVFGETLGHSWMKCSECCVSQSGQTLTFTYCPNCGAKMEVDE